MIGLKIILYFDDTYAIIEVEEITPKSIRSGCLLERDRGGFVFLYRQRDMRRLVDNSFWKMIFIKMRTKQKNAPSSARTGGR